MYVSRHGAEPMNKKLTLRLDDEAIEKAKQYASERGISVSKLVENFFVALEREEPSNGDGDLEISPFVESLRGTLPEDADEEDYIDHLEEKHG
jgi:hypothetical protein